MYVETQLQSNEKVIIHYVNFTNPLSFQTKFPKTDISWYINTLCFAHKYSRLK